MVVVKEEVVSVCVCVKVCLLSLHLIGLLARQLATVDLRHQARAKLARISAYMYVSKIALLRGLCLLCSPAAYLLRPSVSILVSWHARHRRDR